MVNDAAQLARLLAADIAAVVAELLPAGRRHGAEWRAGSVAGEPGQSLAVHLTGPRAGVWSDFAGGGGGDALDLVAATLFSGDLGAAVAWARQRYGLAAGAAPAQAAPAVAPAAADPAAELEAAERRRAAVRIFLGAHAALAGTPAAAYLAARGIDLAELGRQPRSLRFHPGLFNAETRRTWPALVAAISGPDGVMQGLHRIWLARDAAGIWRKAPLENSKMSLGAVSGGTIRLWRGASGKPLREAPADAPVVIGEGIETCLSVALACPELRVLAAVSLGNLAKIVLPPQIRSVIIAADNDPPTSPAAVALQRAVAHFQSEGRGVRIARSPVGKDFNDCLADHAA